MQETIFKLRKEKRMNFILFIIYFTIFPVILSMVFSQIVLCLFFAIPEIKKLKILGVLTSKAGYGRYIFLGLFWLSLYVLVLLAILNSYNDILISTFILSSIYAFFVSLKSLSEENYYNNFRNLMTNLSNYIDEEALKDFKL